MGEAGARKTFDTSGKSPAYLHHRENSKARAGKPAAVFFNPSFLNRTAGARHGATSSQEPLPEASQAGRRPSLQRSSAQNVLSLSAIGNAEVHKMPLRNVKNLGAGCI